MDYWREAQPSPPRKGHVPLGNGLLACRAVISEIRFSPTAPAEPAADGVLTVILDPTFSGDGDRGASTIGLRALASEVLTEGDLIEEGSRLLDRWADESGIAGRMIVHGVSIWYRQRLAFWWWVIERVFWARALGRLLRGPLAREFSLVIPPHESALADVAVLLARERGIRVEILAEAPAGASFPSADGSSGSDPTRGSPGSVAPVGYRYRIRRRLGLLPRQRQARLVRSREAQVLKRLADFSHSKAPVILVLTQTVIHQTVTRGRYRRRVNPFLDSILEHLRSSPLRPLILELDTRLRDESVGRRLTSREGRDTLPGDLLHWVFERPGDLEEARQEASGVAVSVRAAQGSLPASGIELGPALTEAVASYVDRSLAAVLRVSITARRLIERLRPAALLMIFEYGNVEWTGAAHTFRVPVAAVQHGVIHPWHPGYVHGSRPPGLPIADRTYVFGQYERRLLLQQSVYRDGEVRVVGSPRLDLAESLGDAGPKPGRPGIRAAVRAELGIALDELVLLVTTTNGDFLHRVLIPATLEPLFDRELANVHVVFKVHPREPDDDFYPTLIAEFARMKGFRPPALSVVRDYDLYRLLAAADAHLGLYTTVLTEAVMAGIPNLVPGDSPSADILDYVRTGVAQRVRNGGELLAALAGEPSVEDEEARRVFLADHFAAGPAGRRIVEDLEAMVSSQPISTPGAQEAGPAKGDGGA